jgi:hypothetical protein
VFLIPGQSAVGLGAEVLIGGLLTWIAIIWLHLDSFRRMDPAFRRRSLTAAVFGHVMAVAVSAAGLALIFQGPAGVYWLAPGLLLSYVIALANAWVLIVEINR